MILGKRDKRVITAFTDRRKADGYKLSTDGRRLDGAWMGGSNIASWENGKIVFHDLGSRAAQTIQRAVRKVTPRGWYR